MHILCVIVAYAEIDEKTKAVAARNLNNSLQIS